MKTKIRYLVGWLYQCVRDKNGKLGYLMEYTKDHAQFSD